MLAGVSLTWYTWLEQGRPINASLDVLDSLARVLRLDPVEREHLLMLAGLPARRPLSPGRETVPASIRHLLSALEPAPGAAVLERGHTAVREFLAALDDLVQRRRAEPGDPQAAWSGGCPGLAGVRRGARAQEQVLTGRGAPKTNHLMRRKAGAEVWRPHQPAFIQSIDYRQASEHTRTFRLGPT